jgi:hypothetical protein
MKKEIWKEIKGYGGKYSVSNAGRVKSDNGWYEKILKQTIRNRYPTVGLHSPKKKQTLFSVHTLVLEAFRKKRPKNKQCAHIDGNSKNNNLKNLAWVTPKENARHRGVHGTQIRGESHPMVKLKIEDIINIISMNLAGFNRKEVTKKYKISEGHYYRIIRGDTWKSF